MKKIFKVVLVAFIVSAAVATTTEVKAQSASVSFSVFYNALRPYGRWVNHGSYGQVWVANQRNFTPYSTGGHWAYTDDGWTWVSDYSWGWAPFHYGRWAYERGIGWYWVPDYQWGPAWVAWRDGGDYYGWAPLSPGLNISVGVSFGNEIPYDRWVFTPRRYITSPVVYRYYVPRTRNVTIIKNTTVINNVTVRNNERYIGGPRREDVEKVTHQKVRTYTVANSSKPGRAVVKNNTINVYRPVVNKTTVNNTTINKNSNNTTVNKNSNNNTTVNKNSNNKTANKNSVKKSVTNNKKAVQNNVVNKTNNTTRNNNAKKQAVEKKAQNNTAQVKQQAKKPVVQRAAAEQNKQPVQQKVDEARNHPNAAVNKVQNNKQQAKQRVETARQQQQQRQQKQQQQPKQDQNKKPNQP